MEFKKLLRCILYVNIYESIFVIKILFVIFNKVIINFLFIFIVKYIVISDENIVVIIVKSIGEYLLYIVGIKIFIIKVIVIVKVNRDFNLFFFVIKRIRVIKLIFIIYSFIFLFILEI